MMERALNVINVVTMPTLGGIFAADLYMGNPASWGVYAFAGVGLFFTFINSASALLDLDA